MSSDRKYVDTRQDRRNFTVYSRVGEYIIVEETLFAVGGILNLSLIFRARINVP